MADHAFHRTGDFLVNEDVVFICRALKADNLKLLCLRECRVREKDMERILELVGSCQSLHQLTLNIGMVTSMRHVQLLSRCIKRNKSLTGLHIHGSDLGDVGMQALGHALSSHPGIVSLDIGDCKLGDMSIDVLYSLMLPVNNRPGITELTLSDNPRISALGWAQFGMCLANCNSLRWLFLDYNPLGDYGAACVLVALSASQSLELLDMEGCGLTEHSGQAILHLVQNHLGSLTRVKLSNNRIRKSTTEAIKKHIHDNHLDDSESVSTVTVDDLFSLNMTRQHHSSSFKGSVRRKSSSSSSRSSSTSSLGSRSSSSSSDSSSDNDKKKKKKKKEDSEDEDGDKKMHQKNKKVNSDKSEGELSKETKTDKKKKASKNKAKKNDEDNSKKEDKDKKSKTDKKIDTSREIKKDVTNKEFSENDLDADDNDIKEGKNKKKDNDKMKSVDKGENKVKSKEKDNAKNKKEDKERTKDKDEDKCEKHKTKSDKCKDKSSKNKDNDKSDKNKDKTKKKKKNEKKEEPDETECPNKNKKKTLAADSNDDETDNNDESLGDELTEVPIFYK